MRIDGDVADVINKSKDDFYDKSLVLSISLDTFYSNKNYATRKI